MERTQYSNKARRVIVYSKTYDDEWINREDFTLVDVIFKGENKEHFFYVLEKIDTSELDQLKEQLTLANADASEFEEALSEEIDKVNALTLRVHELENQVEQQTATRVELQAENNRLRNELTKRVGKERFA